MADERLSFYTYQQQAARTMREHPKDARALGVAVLGLGITGEAGEVADYLKKVLGHGHKFEREVLVKELGDVLWYVAALATEYGIPLEDVATVNIEKLRERFPAGFTEAASVARVDMKMTVHVNGKAVELSRNSPPLTFDEIVQLAGLTGTPTVTLKGNPPEIEPGVLWVRILHPSDTLAPFDGLIINAVHTGNA